ncbi:MAG: type II toxin-antitoxin system VapC family toxin [Nitrospirae bacterium]|nr:type II toxin-antitoxin system VapC family toxin [Nitrospirota bacterium]MDA1304376.1 type II toxin-antitoxin system VapC family toxin [Nitrospirota bacterium]
MKIMLDTNICIYIIKQQPQSVLEIFTSFVVGDIGISVMTLAELEFGVSKSLHQKRNRQALEQFIEPLEVATFDDKAARVYGELRTKLEAKGQLVGSMDLLIAAHALSLGVRIATNNEREFKRVPGLRVENWA